MNDPITELRAFARASLLDPVDREREESAEALVQRRWVASTALAVGSFMLALTLRLPAGDLAFYGATMALAATWIVGGMLSGKLYLGAAHTRSGEQDGRGILQAIIIGAVLLGIFLSGAALVAPVPAVRESLVVLLNHARYGILPVVAVLTALVSIGEEIFFRGALYAAVGGRQALLVTTIVYALATIPSGIPLMVVAAAVIGVVTGLQRRVTGGVLAPVVTHLIWSMGLLFLLPLALGV